MAIVRFSCAAKSRLSLGQLPPKFRTVPPSLSALEQLLSVAAALLQHKDLRVFTNNLNIALLMCSNPTFEVNVAGGQVRNSDGDVLGPGMERFLSSYLFDFGIYGVAGVESDGTLVDFSEREVWRSRADDEKEERQFDAGAGHHW